jgi:site-specific DNA-methyltransferase (adenine-specific)
MISHFLTNYKKNDYKNVIKCILYYNTMKSIKLIKKKQKYPQVTLDIHGEEEQDNTPTMLEDSPLLMNNLNVNDNTNLDEPIHDIDLTKLTKLQLLERCQQLGITNCKSKNKDKLIELIKSKTQFQRNFIIQHDITNPPADVKGIPPADINNEIVILNGDCMIELNKLEENSIDCVITDPPYFIDKLDNNWSSNKVNEDVKNSHITHLPKGMKFDKLQTQTLYEYYLELSKLLFKKMKPGAYFLSFSSPRLYHAIAMSCDIAGFEIRDMINWTYTQSMPKGMSVSHIIEKMKITQEEKIKLIDEYKDYKTPQIRSCFEPICVAMKPLGKVTFIQNELNFKTGLLDFSQKVGIDNDRVPANIITTEEYNESYDKNFLVSKPSKTEKGQHNSHITVKPIALIEHLIKLFSKKGSIVVDPFLGSGTTALACKNTGRKCIGTEINSEYYNICLDRCK